MQLIMLVERRMLPVPEGIVVIQEFGHESIIPQTDSGNDKDETMLQCIARSVQGTSMFVEGEPQAFIDWLKDYDGIWSCNNPMMGDWQVMHIKESVK